MDGERRTMELGVINEQAARIVCETSPDCSCVVCYFFLFIVCIFHRLSCPSVYGVCVCGTYGEREKVYVEESSWITQSQFMWKGDWIVFGEEWIKKNKQQPAYGMKCHKIATPKKMKKKRTNAPKIDRTNVHTCYLFFLRYSKVHEQKKPIPFSLPHSISLANMKVYTINFPSISLNCDSKWETKLNFPFVHTMYFLIFKLLPFHFIRFSRS